ncbi:hypothetical protein C5C31_14770 [Rathayibacter rathayi]|uniref:Antitoxin VbhA domain-containing protein n=1 Tax=Rathayibacter rathayi TaxID=33887 RepID=A0ABD6W9Z6_RATRA|nr:hypothetical protein C1O28_11755 [Rathayibacter rathayi]PPF14355.1 hypothetical protein C5C04_07085 [Rathayibacter rathayi]PPF22203.1 hypothetical protein C5C34_12000 [Rathayibacter rathayi]PPF46701.1 hypothetical protein C5C08_11160 [Rathayibacter rathayi]PPF78584.1 hypothetical protein C5C14_11075 [Rathayibacter rathayi]
MARALASARPVWVDVDRNLAFADAALALAGHEVTDPVLCAIAQRAARHELTGDEAVAEIRRHVQG